MRKIINRKLYDTDTATELLTYADGYNRRDFRYYEEHLYQKRTKEFFLHGEGGPMSPYRCRIEGSGYIEGERIIPMTEQEAQDWVASHFDADEYIEIIGDVAE